MDVGFVNVGGGAIRLAVGGTLTLNGVATATPIVNSNRSGAAGSIDITAARLEGSGRIEANPLPTSFEGYRDVFCRLGFPIGTSTFTSLFPPEGGNLNLLPAIIGPKRSWEQWIGIAPLSDYPSKTYPIEKMEQVVKRLSADHPKARFFLFSHDNKAKQLFSCWVAQMPQCVEVWHHLENMQQELILMSHLDVMLSMDSAAMHLASLTATPVVSVWGATHPYAGLAGWGQQQENVLGIDMECRPCSLRGHKPCRRGDLACLNGIAEETIVEKVNQILLTHQK